MFSFLVALQFLTTLPVPVWRQANDLEIARSLRYFPVTGVVIGGILALLYYLLSLWFPHQLVTLVMVIALIALTGALHIDGFLDSCDGLMGSHTVERRLEIMRDSRVGSFAVAGGWSLLSLKYLALFLVPPQLMLHALLLAPMLGRWAMVNAVVLFPYGRDKGFGSPYRMADSRQEWLLATAAVMLLGGLVLQWVGLVIPLFIIILTFLIGRWVMTRLPAGLTGDNYGAIAEITEVATWLIIQASAGLIMA
ncbi:MAG: adenosylcobinamide-GDP ribazoletransferase [Chloroflexota bacterium]|nr:adenosylcobinamide-GDP ribazoletransferase [Chloroflexota bacterium]